MSIESLQENGYIQENGDGFMTVRGEYRLPQADVAEKSTGDQLKQFLVDHSDELRLPAEATLAEIHSATSPLGRVVRYQQQLDGLPVLKTEILIATNPAQDRVVEISLDREPVLQVVTPAGDQQLTPEQALQSALDEAGAPQLRMEPSLPTEALFPVADGLHRVFVVLLATQDPPHDWRFLIDAATGEVLDREDLIEFVDGSGFVFDPNPVVTGKDDTLRDPDATANCGFTGTPRPTIDAQRVTRPLRDITFNPVNGRHQLTGPFVAMRNFGSPNTPFPEEADAHAFTYSSGDPRFEAVNVYYAIDSFQRYLQDPAQGPRITTARNSQIPCDPHEGNGSAFYSPIDRGLHFSNSGPCRPDRAEDAHVMIHEYGHAIHHDQVPNWGATNPITGRAETRAMGEGYGDAMACIFYADHEFLPEVFEPWIFGDQGGLRRVDGAKIYPHDWVHQVHADGEIWSAALWNAYRSMGGSSAVATERETARHALIKTVTLSHHMLTGSASMPDAAEAVMRTNAILPHYQGRHLTAMLESFHERGILLCDPDADLQFGNGSTAGTSEDLWVRHTDDNGTTHQPPVAGQDNQMYARIRNGGTTTARAFVVNFTIRPLTESAFTYPHDFLPPISAACGFTLPPGASTIVRATLPEAHVPAAGSPTHLLASVYTPTDMAPDGSQVGEHNNLAQRELAPVPNASMRH